MVKPRRKGTARIEDPKECSTTLCKRCGGLFKKASELSQLTGAQVAVIVFSAKDKLRSFGEPSVEKIIQKYLRHKGDVIPPTSRREWEDWAKKEYGSCATKRDLASSIMKHESVLDYLRKKLKDLEDNPSVKAGAGDDSLKDCIRDGSSGKESARSDLEGSGKNEDDIFAELKDLEDVALVIKI